MQRNRSLRHFCEILSHGTIHSRFLAANFSREKSSRREMSSKWPERLGKPLEVTEKLLMGPGPANCPPRVLEAAAKPLLGHLHPDFCEIMDDVKAGIKHLFQTENELTIALCASGHAAMEATLVNTLEAGEKVGIAKNGIWGERAADIASRAGINVAILEGTPGKSFSKEEIEGFLEKEKPKAFFITHGESSTGVFQNIKGIGEICKKNSCLFMVDSVAACGGVELKMDEWGIDVLYTGSQKVLSAPPGTAPISFSPRARQAIRNRETPVQSYYLDVEVLGRYWNVDAQPRFYHHTGAVTNIFALREALSFISSENLEETWKRHKICQKKLHEGLKELGLELFVENQDDRLPCVTTIKVPDGVEWNVVTALMMENDTIEMAGGLGPTAGKCWRIGLMGFNCTEKNVNKVLRSLQKALQTIGYLSK
ncbi:Oidioi.mRNA.OKI2018_I69.chr1.g566.t1.cds [Oikopleura dioica]|uniref:Alanine--glyoxylate aminotransferase n=1 Tax=Oikopleura dioica TaxID=34765 RepID=A0ABN7SK83_OIKDI|nr:Oidioi.mRNA.OKI2018_I69.chr1.g566.t1.cds [Oikopleura dioica]